jgi:integrase
MRRAEHKGYVPRNVCRAVVRPRVQRKPFAVLTAEQAQALLDAAKGDRLYARYVLALTTGMRQGELLGLRWRDVDLDAATVAVQRSVSEVNGKLHHNEPKTTSGRRSIALSALAVQALRSHRAAMLAEGYTAPDRPVFCDTVGGWMRKQNLVRRSFKPLLTAAKLPTIRFHDLRHSAATLLLAENVHPKIVQERLGHSTIAVTLDTYSHVSPSMQRAAADKLDSIFPAPAPAKAG